MMSINFFPLFVFWDFERDPTNGLVSKYTAVWIDNLTILVFKYIKIWFYVLFSCARLKLSHLCSHSFIFYREPFGFQTIQVLILHLKGNFDIMNPWCIIFPHLKIIKRGEWETAGLNFFLIKNWAGHLLIDLPMQRDLYIFSKA